MKTLIWIWCFYTF